MLLQSNSGNLIIAQTTSTKPSLFEIAKTAFFNAVMTQPALESEAQRLLTEARLNIIIQEAGQ